MPRCWNPSYDPILRDLNNRWKLDPYLIADRLGFSSETIRRNLKRLGLSPNPIAREHKSTKEEVYVKPPREKPNPLFIARAWLGSRLKEKNNLFFLDGVPVSLAEVMKTVNAMLKANGAEQVTNNPQWIV